MTFEELINCNRDNDGYILLDPIYNELHRRDELKGKMRKEWLILDDSNALIKFPTNQDSYQNYAELLAEATFLLLGIKSAYYDLVCLNGHKGVISKDIRTVGQVMISFETILKNYEKIYNENTLSAPIVVNRSYNTLIDFEQALIYNGYDVENIKAIIKDLDRVFIARSFLVDFDAHWENLSLLVSNEGQLSLAPQYDSSAICRFMSSTSVISKFYKEYEKSRDKGRAKIISQDLSARIPQDVMKANLKYSRNDRITYGIESIRDAVLKDRNRFYQILIQTVKVDYHSAIREVEERIKNPLPDLCKKWYLGICRTQIQMINKIIRDIESQEQEREN